MSRVAFRQCDVERVLRALKAVGDDDRSVEITPEGAIRILTRVEAPDEASLSPLERWERKHGKRGA